MKNLLLAFLTTILFLCANSQSTGEDSLLFAMERAAFEKFEQEHAHYIQTPNVKLHYLTWGKPSGIPVVWVHGTYSNAYEFYSFADSLAKRGYFIIAVDYYGHGLTPIPDKEVSIYHVADDIKFLLHFLKIRKAVIGGWSRGGSIATAFYDAYPQMVSGIILEDGGSVAWATNDHRASIDSKSVQFTRDFEKYAASESEVFESAFAAVNQSAGFKNRSRVFHALSAIKRNTSGKWESNPGLAAYLGEGSVADFLQIFYRPFAPGKLFGASTVLLYPKIIYRNLDVPLLILDAVAKNDPFPFEKENRELQLAHPSLITHKIYADTYHGLKFQRPKEFLGDVLSFLETIKKRYTGK